MPRPLLPFLRFLTASLLASGLVWSLTPPPSLALPPATDWPQATPSGNPRLALLLLDQPSATRLRAFLHTDLNPPLADGPFISTDSLRFLSKPDAHTALRHAATTFPGKPAAAVEISLEWLGEPPVRQSSYLFPASGRIVSTYRAGTTTFTRTLLTDPATGAVLLHFLADQPGALSFRATLRGPGTGPTTLENRRELTHSHRDTEARAWILPFESDVEPAGNSILLRGEGEALVLLNFGPKSAPHPPADTLKRLAATHDPGHPHPDPSKIWNAIRRSRPDWPASPAANP